ncbi:hypothetical protein MKX01_035830 [Papaver californicum]|nr:hypothetical protein MKX01_035830 [Papaver californicum]
MGKNTKRKTKEITDDHNGAPKTQKLNPNNNPCYVQILGTGLDTQDTSPSILLFFDNQRFLFNAGEGFQRFCTGHKIKLSQIDHVLLTRVCSETAGGLAGVLLTLAGISARGGGRDEGAGMSVNLWGPSGLQYLVDAMKCFVPNKAVDSSNSFGFASLSPNGAVALSNKEKFTNHIDSEGLKISAILLKPTTDGAPMSNQDISDIYVCELPEIKGKFDLEKANVLGLKDKSKFHELQLGKSVTVSDTDLTIVHPSDAMGASVAVPIVIIVDCPTLFHLQHLISLNSLCSYYDGVKIVNCYQTWMRRFGGAQHIMAGHEKKNMEIPILKSSAKIATRLNYLCPNLFPLRGLWAHNQNPDNGESDNTASSLVAVPNPSQSVAAENLLKFRLRPYSQLGLDKSAIPELLGLAEVVDELILETPEIVDAAVELSHLWKKTESNLHSSLENIARDDMEIVFLGAGSSQPSKYRNVSSIFINLFSKGKRRFGVMGANDTVRGLKCIWFSHMHADHHLGIASILSDETKFLT